MDVHVNAAMSADGKLSTRDREQVEISGPADFERVSRLRSEADGVLVGVGTVLADDPSLGPVHGRDATSIREEGTSAEGGSPPTRVVADSRARTPPEAAVLSGGPPTIVLVTEAAPDERVEEIENAGGTVVVHGRDRVNLVDGFSTLEDRGIDKLLVEGGGELIFSLFEANLVDRLTVYIAPTVIGGRNAPTLVDGPGVTEAFPRLVLEDCERIDGGVLLTYDC